MTRSYLCFVRVSQVRMSGGLEKSPSVQLLNKLKAIRVRDPEFRWAVELGAPLLDEKYLRQRRSGGNQESSAYNTCVCVFNASYCRLCCQVNTLQFANLKVITK